MFVFNLIIKKQIYATLLNRTVVAMPRNFLLAGRNMRTYSLEIMKNWFTGSSYFFEDTVYFSGNIESETDVESYNQ